MRESLEQKNIAWGFFCQNGFLEKTEDVVGLGDEVDLCGGYRCELPCSSFLWVV